MHWQHSRAIRWRKAQSMDEPEYGHHYARAMASWTSVVALSGFSYHGEEGSVVAVPRLPHRTFDCFWQAEQVGERFPIGQTPKVARASRSRFWPEIFAFAPARLPLRDPRRLHEPVEKKFFIPSKHMASGSWCDLTKPSLSLEEISWKSRLRGDELSLNQGAAVSEVFQQEHNAITQPTIQYCHDS